MDVDVLVAGAGPVGVTTALELRRRGVDVLIVDPRPSIAPWAKAVGVQPRSMELWDQNGVIRDVLDAATSMRGQIVFVNGEKVNQLDTGLPDDVPYHFICLPQYETERILGDHLTRHGGAIERGSRLVAFEQDGDGVTATVESADGTTRIVRSRYLVGCDGAHSIVRKTLGLSFEGDAFPEEYMLADVEVDWDLPDGFGIRAIHKVEGQPDDLMVCIPLPGHRRYRISMLAPQELRTAAPAPGEIAHGIEAGRAPELPHIQAVLDRLSPVRTTASRMRWSSIFRISHRLVDRYGSGRVFVAGDAAHIHPPTGGQGMNTGIQDGTNLAWKLALAVRGQAAPGLLDSYHAERHPIGEQIVGRTTKAARQGIGAGETSVAQILLTEAQLLLNYPDSPIVGTDDEAADAAGPAPGDRAPDAAGLRQETTGFPIRWHELLRHTDHTALLWAGGPASLPVALDLAEQLTRRTDGLVRPYIVVPESVTVPATAFGIVVDAAGTLAAAYGLPAHDVLAGIVVRPDGYIGYRAARVDRDRLLRWLGGTLAL